MQSGNIDRTALSTLGNHYLPLPPSAVAPLSSVTLRVANSGCLFEGKEPFPAKVWSTSALSNYATSLLPYYMHGENMVPGLCGRGE